MRSVVSTILLILNIVVALALLVSGLAGYISPQIYWPMAFLGFSFPMLFVLNILFLILWLIFLKKKAAISLVVILLNIGHVPKFFSFNEKRQKPESAKTIRVMTYNVNLFNQYNPKADNADAMLRFIADQKADVICLQDFFTIKQTLSEGKIKAALSNYPYCHLSYSVINNDREIKYGLAIFSKYKIVKKSSVHFGDKSYNSAIYSDIKIGDDTIRFFCGHLESTKLESKDKPYKLKERIIHKEIDVKGLKAIVKKLKGAYLIRAKQADSIRKVEDRTKYRSIFCGDFNDLPLSYTYSKIKGNMYDSYTEAGRGFTSTYLGFFPTMRIDYILSDTSIIPYRYRSPRVKYSDHYPVIVDLYYTAKK